MANSPAENAAAIARKQALLSGLKRYQGTVCKKCSGTERYAKSTCCVYCDREKSKLKSRVQRAYGSSLRQKYGLSLVEYEQMKQDQNECCAICGIHEREAQDRDPSRYRLHVDHNHKTKQIRSLLCRRCNLAIGWVNEDISVLEKMIEYLRRWDEAGDHF